MDLTNMPMAAQIGETNDHYCAELNDFVPGTR